MYIRIDLQQRTFRKTVKINSTKKKKRRLQLSDRIFSSNFTSLQEGAVSRRRKSYCRCVLWVVFVDDDFSFNCSGSREASCSYCKIRVSLLRHHHLQAQQMQTAEFLHLSASLIFHVVLFARCISRACTAVSIFTIHIRWKRRRRHSVHVSETHQWWNTQYNFNINFQEQRSTLLPREKQPLSEIWDGFFPLMFLLKSLFSSPYYDVHMLAAFHARQRRKHREVLSFWVATTEHKWLINDAPNTRQRRQRQRIHSQF